MGDRGRDASHYRAGPLLNEAIPPFLFLAGNLVGEVGHQRHPPRIAAPRLQQQYQPQGHRAEPHDVADHLQKLVDADPTNVKFKVLLATEALERFPHLFHEHWLNGMRAKLGLFTCESDDEALVNGLLAWMRGQSADFTNTFRSLTKWVGIKDPAGFESGLTPWLERWEARRGRQPQSSADAATLMRRHNPAFIPRNHRVEEALLAATSAGDLSVMETLLEVLANPFDYERDAPKYTEPGTDHGTYRTFCGT